MRRTALRRWGIPLAAVVVLLIGGVLYHWHTEAGLDALLESANRSLLRKDFAAVEHAAAVLQRSRPDDHGVLLLSGRLLGAREQWPRALEVLERIPDDSLHASDARFFEGLVHFSMHQGRRAEASFLKALQLDPGQVPALEQLVELYSLQLRPQNLRIVLQAVLPHRPWTTGELALYVSGARTWGAPYTRASILRQFADTDPRDAASLLTLATSHLELAEPDRAIAALTAAGASQTQSARFAAVLAEAYLSKSDRESAARILKQIDPAAVEAWAALALGRWFSETGDWPRAEQALRFAAAQLPHETIACYRLGSALQRAQRHDEAARWLERARSLGELEQQAMVLNTIQHDPTRLLDVLLTTGELLLRLERWFEAGIVFEHAKVRSPADLRAAEGHAEALRHWSTEGAQRLDPPPDVHWSELLAAMPGAQDGTPTATAASEHSRLRFVDLHHKIGIDFQYFSGQTGFRYVVEAMGGGVAAFDYDGDGWCDLFFPQGCRIPFDANDSTYRNVLYRNLGGKAEDVSRAAGLADNHYGLGCASGDVDNDGDADLIVTNFGPTLFFANNGDGTFHNVASGIVGERMSASAALADFDRDGDLDLYVVNYLHGLKICRGKDDRPATCHPREQPAEQDRLYENTGDGRFRDITDQAGIVVPNGKGLGIVVADFNDDTWPDVYVANDTTPNFLFQNVTGESAERSIQFREQGLASGTAVNEAGQAEAGMGIACADFDGNGLLDLHVTNYFQESNTLYLNQGQMAFADATRAYRLKAPTMDLLGFGTQALDADLDGWPDLFVTNGHVDDYSASGQPWKMRPQLFANVGGQRFADASDTAGPFFTNKYLGRGAARLDWDRDGRMDLAVVHQDQPAALLLNESPRAGHYLAVELVGTASNRDGVNARLTLRANGRTQIDELAAGSGYLADNQRLLIFGLGTSSVVDELSLRWPSGSVAKRHKLAADRTILLVEGRSD